MPHYSDVNLPLISWRSQLRGLWNGGVKHTIKHYPRIESESLRSQAFLSISVLAEVGDV